MSPLLKKIKDVHGCTVDTMIFISFCLTINGERCFFAGMADYITGRVKECDANGKIKKGAETYKSVRQYVCSKNRGNKRGYSVVDIVCINGHKARDYVNAGSSEIAW
jgi:hypothetical protein